MAWYQHFFFSFSNNLSSMCMKFPCVKMCWLSRFSKAVVFLLWATAGISSSCDPLGRALQAGRAGQPPFFSGKCTHDSRWKQSPSMPGTQVKGGPGCLVPSIQGSLHAGWPWNSAWLSDWAVWEALEHQGYFPAGCHFGWLYRRALLQAESSMFSPWILNL